MKRCIILVIVFIMLFCIQFCAFADSKEFDTSSLNELNATISELISSSSMRAFLLMMMYNGLTASSTYTTDDWQLLYGGYIIEDDSGLFVSGLVLLSTGKILMMSYSPLLKTGFYDVIDTDPIEAKNFDTITSAVLTSKSQKYYKVNLSDIIEVINAIKD